MGVSQADWSKDGALGEVCEYTVTRMLGGQGTFREFQVVCKAVSETKKRAHSGVRGIRTLTYQLGDRGQGHNCSPHIHHLYYRDNRLHGVLGRNKQDNIIKALGQHLAHRSSTNGRYFCADDRL